MYVYLLKKRKKRESLVSIVANYNVGELRAFHEPGSVLACFRWELIHLSQTLCGIGTIIHMV